MLVLAMIDELMALSHSKLSIATSTLVDGTF
jgi:hypothetical protein